MNNNKTISVFEHQRLYVGDRGFKQSHLEALLKLNDYHQGNYFEPITKGIKFNQYVGIIQVDGLTIEINPKADKEDDDNKWKEVLLQMLQACGKIKPSSAGSANVKRQNLNLLEVYFELYMNEINSLLRKGFIKQYRKQTNNTKALKGKLEFAGHLSKNLIHKERFYTTHQIYDSDHLLYQVLYKALTIIEQFTYGSRLQDVCKRLSLCFPAVSEKNITASQINGIKLNRKTAGYSYALELARLIILNYSPDLSSGKDKMLSLLFDMNDLWEEYILKQLQNYCKGTDIQVSGQESIGFWGSNTLRPDIVLRQNANVFIIDTKWKMPNKNSASVGDLRQIYTYCRFWNAEKAMLLYPGKSNKNEFKSYLTDDYSLNVNNLTQEIDHQCKMGMVSVLNSENKLNKNLGAEILSLLKLNI